MRSSLRSPAPKSPGLAVLVRKDGRTVFERGYGVRDLRSMRKIDAETNFRLASFTKQFTAMAVMLLVRDGKLRYDQPLTDIFPGFPPYARAITVRHLLTHTSGLPDYEDAMDANQWTPEHQIQDEDVLALLQRQAKPQFAAGTSWAYSNSAYVLLGLIVAKVSGEPFGQFLEDRIFKPLHMRDTLAYRNGKKPYRIAHTAIRRRPENSWRATRVPPRPPWATAAYTRTSKTWPSGIPPCKITPCWIKTK